MRKWFIVLLAFAAVSVIVVQAFWEQGQKQNLSVRRTVIAKVSTGTDPFTAFLPTDLNGDGKTELLALCGYNSPMLILHPFDRLKTLQLPPPICDLSDLTPNRKMKRYPTLQFTWLLLKGTKFFHEPFPSQVHGTFKGAKVVDADGDGVVNDLLVVMRDGNRLKRWQFMLDENGNWQLEGVLPDKGYGLSASNGYLLFSGDLQGDVDGDGKNEIIKAQKHKGKWQLEILCRGVMGKRWQPVAKSSPFVVKTRKGQIAELAALWVHDLNGDGRKEIIGVWLVGSGRPIFCGPLSFSLPFASMKRLRSCALIKCYCSTDRYPSSAFIFYWQGNRLSLRRFERNLLLLPGMQSHLFNCAGNRYLLLPKLVRWRVFLPRLASFNPPIVNWWLESQQICTEIWLLPKSNDALEPSKWRKIAELLGEPLTVGDWDKDKRAEILLLDGFTGKTPQVIFAQLHGHDGKVRWTSWQINRRTPKLPTRTLPLVEANRCALFIVWNDRIIERVKW